MRNRGVVVAVFIACVSCFSTASYDRAHTQRVSTINARYDAELARERQRHDALVTELERRRASLLAVMPVASSHNESMLDDIDRQSALLAQRHARVQSRIEQLRQRELAASQHQRAREIEVGRAERRARVRAAADAFAAEARGQPSLAPAPATAARSTADHAPDAVLITCEPDAPETIGQATALSSHNHVAPSTSIDCRDDADCPGGMSCDASAGVCCATIVR
jgi:Skp family chaperone for outer membrane proteins